MYIYNILHALYIYINHMYINEKTLKMKKHVIRLFKKFNIQFYNIAFVNSER